MHEHREQSIYNIDGALGMQKALGITSTAIDTKANWESINLVIPLGITVTESDTLMQKMGDGKTNYINLDYISPTKTKLSNNLDLYVADDPNSSNGNHDSGLLLNTTETKLSSISEAVSVASRYWTDDLSFSNNNTTITIHVGVGTYSENVGINGWNNCILRIVGTDEPNKSSRINRLIINHGFPIQLENIYIAELIAEYNSLVTALGNTTFDRCLLTRSSSMNIQGENIKFNGTSTTTDACIYAYVSSHVSIASTSSIIFSGVAPHTMRAVFNSSINIEPGANLSGDIQSSRYLSDGNSIISSNSGGPNKIPGTTAGTTTSGGLYI